MLLSLIHKVKGSVWVASQVPFPLREWEQAGPEKPFSLLCMLLQRGCFRESLKSSMTIRAAKHLNCPPCKKWVPCGWLGEKVAQHCYGLSCTRWATEPCPLWDPIQCLPWATVLSDFTYSSFGPLNNPVKVKLGSKPGLPHTHFLTDDCQNQRCEPPWFTSSVPVFRTCQHSAGLVRRLQLQWLQILRFLNNSKPTILQV